MAETVRVLVEEEEVDKRIRDLGGILCIMKRILKGCLVSM